MQNAQKNYCGHPAKVSTRKLRARSPGGAGSLYARSQSMALDQCPTCGKRLNSKNSIGSLICRDCCNEQSNNFRLTICRSIFYKAETDAERFVKKAAIAKCVTFSQFPKTACKCHRCADGVIYQADDDELCALCLLEMTADEKQQYHNACKLGAKESFQARYIANPSRERFEEMKRRALARCAEIAERQNLWKETQRIARELLAKI